MHTTERVQAAVRRHPRWADGGLAAMLALLNLPSLVDADVGVASWLGFGAAHLPLIWRRRAPVAVFWTICVLAGLSVATSPAIAQGMYPETLGLVAVYTVALYCPRRHLWPALAVLEGTLLAAALLGDPRGGPWNSLALGTSGLAAAALLGVTIRTRRAYLAALEERAHRAERERDQQAQLAAATERARIAREMHDIVAHNLTVMVALADGAAFTAPTAPERAADTMQQVSATGRQALTEMRRLLGLLGEHRPSPVTAPAANLGEPPRPDIDQLSPQPGLDDLDRLIEQVRRAGVRVTLTCQGVPGRWGPGAGLAVYRIVQEALTNTLKHAGPQASAHVRLGYTPIGVDLEVTDDGAGRAARSVVGTGAGGHGLAGMLQRAASYGGHVEAGPRPEGGWQVRARLRLDDRHG
jgi:signal transduction histidine kinase